MYHVQFIYRNKNKQLHKSHLAFETNNELFWKLFHMSLQENYKCSNISIISIAFSIYCLPHSVSPSLTLCPSLSLLGGNFRMHPSATTLSSNKANTCNNHRHPPLHVVARSVRTSWPLLPGKAEAKIPAVRFPRGPAGGVERHAGGEK